LLLCCVAAFAALLPLAVLLVLQSQKQVGSALNSIAYGQAMMAAVRDYAKVSSHMQPVCLFGSVVPVIMLASKGWQRKVLMCIGPSRDGSCAGLHA
jgi:hypothetical protein